MKKTTIILVGLLGILFLGLFTTTPFVSVNNISNPVGVMEPSDGEITIFTPENKTYTEPMSGYYPGSFGFENDEDGTFPEGWVDGSGSGCTVDVQNSHDGYNKVLKLTDSSTTYGAVGDMYFQNQFNGSIEFWFQKTSGATRCYFVLMDSTTMNYAIEGIGDYNGDFALLTGEGTLTDPGGLYSLNTWFHLKLDFDSVTDKVNFSINGNLVFEDKDFYVPTDNVDLFRFGTNSNLEGTYYIDAVSLSWDPNYQIGDNMNEGILLSYENTTNLDWKGYSLDGNANRTIMGNVTIPIPSEGVHNIQLFGNDSLNTMYESDLGWFTIDTSPYINLITPENMTYINPLTGYYPGSIGFEDEEDGNAPSGWIDYSGSGCSSVVESSFDNHNKILKLEDTSTTYGCGVINYFSNQTSGTVELWFQKTVGTTTCYVLLAKEGVEVVKMAIDSDNNGLFGLNVGGTYEHLSAGYSDNTWFHIRIDFDCATDKSDVYINGVLQFANKDFYHDVDEINNLLFGTNSFRAGTFYTDSVGYSWDPHYSVGDNLKEGLLLSYDTNSDFNWTGYSLDRQANRTIWGNTTFAMPKDGIHTIQVFGNDSVGEITESEIRYFTTNALGPEITLNSPSSSLILGTEAPDFDLTISAPDLDSTWYSLDGGTTNIPFSGLTGTIDQTEWEKIGNGTATVTFFANDTVNNIGQAEVVLRKDIIIPVITINSPTLAEEFEYTPIFGITINEPNLDEFWYTIDEGVNNYTITSLTGTINQAAWDASPEGPVTIRFYAKDDASNIGTNSVIIAKIPSDLPTTPPGIPGYNIITLIGISCVVTLLILKKKYM